MPQRGDDGVGSPFGTVRPRQSGSSARAAGLVLWSVLGDHGLWWIVGAGVLAALQLIAAANVTAAERSRR
jgi:hypothetical protein